MSREGLKKLRVCLTFAADQEIHVGDMLRTDAGVIYFQLASSFLRSGFSLSPIKLKLVPEPQTPLPTEGPVFGGLFGVFADSLPDGWGLLMMSRAMRRTGIDDQRTSALDRLAFVGRRAMGALVYQPASEANEDLGDEVLELSRLAAGVDRVLEGKADDVLPELLVLGGSPGGARPKVVIGVELGVDGEATGRICAGLDPLPAGYEHWLVKFRGKEERPDAGIIEYIYAKTAEHVGLKIEDTKLFQDARGGIWFGTRRFDRRRDGERIHLHTLAGLLHADFRLPSLDYEAFLKATCVLTRRQDDLAAAFLQAAFNVIFHNRDDHAKNFAFTMSRDRDWRLSPAYDLTYSPGPGNEHTMSIVGEGRSPTSEHLMMLAHKAGIDQRAAKLILQRVEDGRTFMVDQLRQFQVRDHPIKTVLGITAPGPAKQLPVEPHVLAAKSVLLGANPLACPHCGRRKTRDAQRCLTCHKHWRRSR